MTNKKSSMGSLTDRKSSHRAMVSQTKRGRFARQHAKEDDYYRSIANSSSIDYEALDETEVKDERTRNLVHAIKLRKAKGAHHSDFYFLLDVVNDRIHMYKSLFLEKQPKYIKQITNIRMASEDKKEREMRELE